MSIYLTNKNLYKPDLRRKKMIKIYIYVIYF